MNLPVLCAPHTLGPVLQALSTLLVQGGILFRTAILCGGILLAVYSLGHRNQTGLFSAWFWKSILLAQLCFSHTVAVHLIPASAPTAPTGPAKKDRSYTLNMPIGLAVAGKLYHGTALYWLRITQALTAPLAPSTQEARAEQWLALRTPIPFHPIDLAHVAQNCIQWDLYQSRYTMQDWAVLAEPWDWLALHTDPYQTLSFKGNPHALCTQAFAQLAAFSQRNPHAVQWRIYAAWTPNTLGYSWIQAVQPILPSAYTALLCLLYAATLPVLLAALTPKGQKALCFLGLFGIWWCMLPGWWHAAHALSVACYRGSPLEVDYALSSLTAYRHYYTLYLNGMYLTGVTFALLACFSAYAVFRYHPQRRIHAHDTS